MMEVTIIEANADNRERIPEGHTGPPVIAVVLPTRPYCNMIAAQAERSFNYHLLTHPDFTYDAPLAFDADTFVRAALTYCREHRVHGVMSFDCLPSLLASVLTGELGLPGPSFRSVFLCCNKYYMRKELTPGVRAAPPSESPDTYPVAHKVSDTQFFAGTRIVHSEREWDESRADLARGILAQGVAERQAFYFKWASHFGWADDIGWQSASDVRLEHWEPCFPSVAEHQVEVVVEANGHVLVADSGNIEHGPNGQVVLFKTPGTFELTLALRAWLDQLVQRLVARGYTSGAMDVEFVRLAGEAEAYALVEINSRYSYMGNFIHFGHAEHALLRSGHAEESRHEGSKEVRNLLNRTRLALGAPPMTLPSRDQRTRNKLCAMMYTEHEGALDDVFDRAALQRLVDEGALDAWVPKPVFLAGRVTQSDLRQYSGWAKGCANLTMDDADLDTINAALDRLTKQLFRGAERGFLPLRVVDLDGDGPTGLAPDVLEQTSCPPAPTDAPTDASKTQCSCSLQ